MKKFSLAVMIYMFMGITWWGVLLYSKNHEYYELKLHQLQAGSQEYEEMIREKERQAIMVMGEGIVLGISLLAGIWIIYRSASKQIEAANSQNNFFLSVSHELKSPIASIKLALQTLLKRKLGEEDRITLTDRAVKDADRLEALVQNILLSAGIEQGTMKLYRENMDINANINQIINKFDSDISESRISTELESTKNLHIYVDRLLIDLAISNVIDNALKYSDPDAPVSVSSRNHQNYIEIHIQDGGIGIERADLDKIFDRFWRSGNPEVRKRKGTGLGLYISQLILKAHHGQIFVEQNSGIAGTRFIFKIPKTDHV